MLTVFLLFLFLTCAAACWLQGLWSSIVTLINFLLAAMIAINYFEPLAMFMNKNVNKSYTYLWDFLLLWGLFAISFGVLRLVTDFASRLRITFNFWVETVGRSLLAIWVAYLFVGFTCLTIHTAPLAAHPFGGGFQKTPNAKNFLAFAPGRQWLAFMQSRSRGALSRGESNSEYLSPLDRDQNDAVRIFDPKSEFIIKYYHRRVNFEQVGGYASQ